jgi:hypothetical protein
MGGYGHSIRKYSDFRIFVYMQATNPAASLIPDFDFVTVRVVDIGVREAGAEFASA